MSAEEQKIKRATRQRRYRKSHREEFRAYNRKYRSSPEVKEKERQYRNSPEVSKRQHKYMQGYRGEHKAEASAEQKAWREKNKDKLRVSKARYDKEYQRKNKGWLRAKHWERYLKRTYGLSLSDYETMYKTQNGLCSICGGVPVGKLRVDHDHQTSFVRGLLCNSCNTTLGHFRDDPAILQKAISYLERARAQQANNVVFLNPQ